MHRAIIRATLLGHKHHTTNLLDLYSLSTDLEPVFQTHPQELSPTNWTLSYKVLCKICQCGMPFLVSAMFWKGFYLPKRFFSSFSLLLFTFSDLRLHEIPGYLHCLLLTALKFISRWLPGFTLLEKCLTAASEHCILSHKGGESAGEIFFMNKEWHFRRKIKACRNSYNATSSPKSHHFQPVHEIHPECSTWYIGLFDFELWTFLVNGEGMPRNL